MKNNEIKVYTLYKSLNFGAYLQAFALQHILKEMDIPHRLLKLILFQTKK